MLVVEQHGGSLRVEAPAKINVGLHLLGKRPDGFHDIESLVMAVSLADELRAEPARGPAVALSVERQGADAPADESNLVLRAARLLQERCGTSRGARLTLVKRIPACRGLGGGSSDAAAALVLLARLWELECPVGLLVSMAAELGSDVPFFLRGPLAIMGGRGERLEPVAGRPPVWVILAVPAVGLSTAEVYRASRVGLTRSPGAARLWSSLLMAGHVEELGRHIANDLEPAAQALCSDLVKVRSVLLEAGAPCVSMTGSGSAVYALVRQEDDALGMGHALHFGAGVVTHVLAPWDSGNHSTREGVCHGSD